MPRNNYKTAAKKAEMQSNLSALDSLGTAQSEFQQGSELSVVENIVCEFISRVQANIQSQGLNVTGSISDIAVETDGTAVNVLAPEHLIYQDLGVSGTERKFNTPFSYKDKMPPVNEIKEWIKTKGIQTRSNDKYGGEKFNLEEGAAFTIAKSIQKEGVKPKNVYSKEIPQLIDDLTDAVADFAVLQFINNI